MSETTKFPNIVVRLTREDILIMAGSDPMPYMITDHGRFFRPNGEILDGGVVYAEWTPTPDEVNLKLGEGCFTLHYPDPCIAIFLG